MKRVYYKSISLVIFFIFVLFSCKKDELKIHELEITSEIFVIGTTSAQITVNYSYMTDLKQVDGYVSTKSDMAEANNFTALIDGKTFVVKFKDLQANTHYYYKFKCFNGVDEIFTDVKTFTTNDYGLPIVTTDNVTNITINSAIITGNVFDDGGFTVTARGVCWSTSQNPTISDSHTSDGFGTETFTSHLSGLSSLTTYYVRTYAINSEGTSYGEQKSFKTPPIGSLAGLFSVSSSKQVCFSQGNLQYQASTNTWRFAENQWDYVGTHNPPDDHPSGGTVSGSDNHSISSSYSGWIDLFGWGTSGITNGALNYLPWSTSETHYNYNAYSSSAYNLNDQTGMADWGYNAISNGGNTTNKWRTLTRDEWSYVFNTRNTNSGIRYAKAQVNGINGVILLPDDWSTSTCSLNSTNTTSASYTTNIITAINWSILENAGAVFLPAAGFRGKTWVFYVGSIGFYWSATFYDSDSAHLVFLYDEGLNPEDWSYRGYAQSVRLVTDVN